MSNIPAQYVTVIHNTSEVIIVHVDIRGEELLQNNHTPYMVISLLQRQLVSWEPVKYLGEIHHQFIM